ncbi:MAG: hypothetical protein R3D98_02330 [Candidatus Krumholzibacteriia bacterium]
MQCPFLRKKNVKFCGLDRRAMIPLGGLAPTLERCSGPDFRRCALLGEHGDAVPDGVECPHLCVTDAHYCELAPVRKLIPCNRTTMSRCADGGHRFCPLFLSVADPRSDATGSTDSDPTADLCLESVPMPATLAFAPNHMWLDRGDGRTCHVGLDAFVTRALGRIDAVSFPYHRDECRPVVRLSVGGAVLDFAFPNAMRCTELNTHLVVDPSEVVRDPYGRGWLFEGLCPPARPDDVTEPIETGLLRGEAARAWMDRECDRLSVFVHDHVTRPQPETGAVMQDGGRPRGRLADLVDSATLHRLHTTFFARHDRRIPR